MLRHTLLRTFAVASFCLVTSTALAQESASGLAIGLRTGYALPAGKIGGFSDRTEGMDLADGVSGMIPLWLDVGYRLNPNIYLGAFFQYGFGIINEDTNPNCNNCSVHDLAFGLDASYRFLPGSPFNPWAGVAVGYENLGLKTSAQVLGQTFTSDSNVKGFQFLTLQFGGDFMASPTLAVGPYINFSIGQYDRWSGTQTGLGGSTSTSGDISNAKTHEWLTLGVRGQFNL